MWIIDVVDVDVDVIVNVGVGRGLVLIYENGRREGCVGGKWASAGGAGNLHTIIRCPRFKEHLSLVSSTCTK